MDFFARGTFKHYVSNIRSECLHACIVKWDSVNRIFYCNSPLIKGKILNFKETPRVRHSVFHRKSIVHVCFALY